MTLRHETNKATLIHYLNPRSQEGRDGVFILHDKNLLIELKAVLDSEKVTSYLAEALWVNENPIWELEVPKPPLNLKRLIDAFSERLADQNIQSQPHSPK